MLGMLQELGRAQIVLDPETYPSSLFLVGYDIFLLSIVRATSGFSADPAKLLARCQKLLELP